jgi:predicted component of type VI protein secretion system
MTTVKSRQPLAAPAANAPSNASSEDMTVEQYLNTQCEGMIDDVRIHGQSLVAKLQAQFQEQKDLILQMMQQQSSAQHEIMCVTLRCMAGAHLGQKFRLEPTTATGDDVFKIGRSTGRLFKEKGVSLYKDKEISTTHAKIELKNGELLLTDTGSTNGTQINSGPDLDRHVTYKLVDGDVICVGSTELIVNMRPLADTPIGDNGLM